MAESFEGRYGIPKDAGGDRAVNVGKMENCVTKMTTSGKSKESAIRICKTSIFGSATGASQEDILAARTEELTAELQGIGKILSQKNVDLIKQCITVLEDLVGLVEPPDASAAEIRIEGGNIVLVEAAPWGTAFMNNLPDSSFAVIEPGGKKDGEGKTVPRSLRHLPYKDASGNVDLPHLRNALARLPQSKISTALKDKARAVLEKAAKSKGVGDYAAAHGIQSMLSQLTA